MELMNRPLRCRLIKADLDNSRGFTLLEVLAAISILTFGLLAVASMQVATIRGNAFAIGVTEATTWASDEMEKLMGLPWNDALLQDTDGDGAGGLMDTGANADQGPVTQRHYTVYWNIADDVPATNTKTLCVVVTWVDHGAQKSVSVRNTIPLLAS
ncbi:MAG: type IV pilus modification PilV family protein [Desulfatiglandales bacterium]